VVSSYVFFRVGSRNERWGRTGLAHLFEHMMFNGGKKFGPGVFDDLIEGNGGSTNGFTTRDYTAYLNDFPREALPVVLDLESDRMAHLSITAENLEQERGIVMEERRLRIDNDVQGSMWEALYLHAFVASPYHWPVIGFMADLERIELQAARDFFRTYYAPNNATLVLAGDVETTEAVRLVEEYFGRIPRGPAPDPLRVEEPEQDGERHVVVRKRAELPAVLVGYRAVATTHADRPALDVLGQILAGGRSARLEELLVREREIATGVWADLSWGASPDLFLVGAQARPGRTAADLLAVLDAGLAAIVAAPPSDAELARAQRQLRVSWVRNLKRVSGKARQIGFYDVAFGDHRAMATIEPSWRVVSAADVQRVARTYLVSTRRTVVELDPLPADGGGS
jgi:predicted Zn-dependent peptidase